MAGHENVLEGIIRYEPTNVKKDGVVKDDIEKNIEDSIFEENQKDVDDENSDVDMVIGIEEFAESLNLLLPQVSDGITILVNDANGKPVSYLLGVDNYKNAMSDKTLILEKNKDLDRALKETIEAHKVRLKTMQQLTNAQKALLKIKNKVPFFNDCTDLELMSVVDNVRILKLAPGEKIFLQHETSKSIYYLVSGIVDILVDVSDSNERKRVGRIMPKDVFGEMAFITKKARSATAQASASRPAILVSFDIKTEIPDNMEYIYMKIYHNFLLSLAKKLEKSN